MSNLRQKFDKLGGLEAAKQALVKASAYADGTIQEINKKFLSTHSLSNYTFGARGVLCAIDRKSGDFKFRTFQGVCHASSRHNEDAFRRDEQVVMFTFPLTLKNEGYKEGFLAAYYKWLSTESLFKDVFLEPFNGEYFCVDLFAPCCKVLGALIMTRLPTEAYFARTQWQAAIDFGFSWWETAQFIQLLYLGGYESIHLSRNGSGAHSVSPITYLHPEGISSLLNEQFLTSVVKKRGRPSTNPAIHEDSYLPWNNENSRTTGVWVSLNNGDKVVYSLTSEWEELIETVLLEQGYTREKTPWGHEWSSKGKVSKEEGLLITFKCIRTFFDKYKTEEKADVACA